MRINWSSDTIVLTIDVPHSGTPVLRSLRPCGTELQDPEPNHDPAVPLAELRIAGEGNEISTSKRLMGSYLSRRLKYIKHQERVLGNAKYLEVYMEDPKLNLLVTSHFCVFSGVPVVRSWVEVHNNSNSDVVLEAVGSLAIGGITSDSQTWWDDYELMFANSSWFREAQWVSRSLPEVGLDDFGVHEIEHDSTRACFVLANNGTFSTCGHLPMGALTKKDGTRTWLWQIEHSGSWRWEIGDYWNSLYLLACGPTDQDSQWSKKLSPGESFTSVTAALGVNDGNVFDAFRQMTEYRRRIRRPHPDNKALPIIFNDYMNCLMGDPTTEKVEALIRPAASAGAEYFCIDCGWYSDDGWWDMVGDWEPSTARFPAAKGGLLGVLNNIRKAGMVPGLWMEPEVVGVKSPVAKKLPDAAFFCRNGQRVLERDRYQLDYRHTAVINRMNNIVDHLVKNFGVGYFKFDYNIDVTQGTDIDSTSPGDGMFEHRRAYVEWVKGLFDRHPTLVIESCSSGAQRLDYHLLAIHPLQSSSDQQDPFRYAAISGSIATAVTPEQNAVWAYPQAEWDDETIAFTVVNSLLGRVHLSGRLDHLTTAQHSIVADGMRVYKQIRKEIRSGLPFWTSLGLPHWHSEWIAVGTEGESRYLAVWRRGGSRTQKIQIPNIDKKVNVECLYPSEFPGNAVWDQDSNTLTVDLPNKHSARLYRLH